jgi:hypothetical protein
MLSAAARDATPNVVDRFALGSGAYASSTESGTLSATFGGDAASTTAILRKAIDDRIPVYVIDRSNVDAALAHVTASASAKSQMRSAIADRNATVTVPESPVNIGGWTGTGYIIQAGETSEYLIQGGASGGALLASVGNTRAVGEAALAASEKAEKCGELPLDRFVFGISTISLAVNFAFLFVMPFPAWILFGALWAVELVLWFVEYVRYLELTLECDDA